MGDGTLLGDDEQPAVSPTSAGTTPQPEKPGTPEQPPGSAADDLHAANERLGRLIPQVRNGTNVRDELDEVRSSIGLTAFRTYGPRPRSRRGEGGKGKLLSHLQANIGQPFHREELSIIASIDDWARRIRELRTEQGYDIEYLEDDHYVLHAAHPDEVKAAEWSTANDIRRLRGVSVTKKLERFLEANVGRIIRRDQLDYVANEKKEATRRVRELRDEQGWPIVSHIDDPDLRPSEYMLLSADPQDRADPNQRDYPVKVRAAVFKRDDYRCRSCHRTREDALKAGDTRFILECDHVVAVADSSTLTDEEKADPTNLQTLCHRCHAVKTSAFQAEQRARRNHVP